MEQILIALTFFIVAAVTIVSIGSKRLLHSKVRLGEVAMGDAVAMPIMGSLTLFSLFLAFKYLPKNIVNMLLSLYLSIGATYALASFLKGYCKPSIATGFFCVGISVGYVYTTHWVLNNILAFALGVLAVETLSIGSFRTAYVLLFLLFCYDIFWVFGTSVMISVATNIKGPVLLTFPQTIFGDHTDKSLLGLGDIIVPGLFISQTLIFSQKCVKRGNFYFYVSLAAYVCSLITTMTVMRIYKHGQPALLYIVPFLCISFAVATLVMGDVKVAWTFDTSNYSEHDTTPSPVYEDDSAVSAIVTAVKEIFGIVKEKKKTVPHKRSESFPGATKRNRRTPKQ